MDKLVLFLLAAIAVSAALARPDPPPSQIPADSSKLDEWLSHNIRKYENGSKDFKYALDGVLMEAEKSVRVIKVRKDGTGDFKTITEALASVPAGNIRRVLIYIGGGEYREKITIDRSKAFIAFYGDANDIPVITYDGTAAKYGTVYSATVAVESDYFVAVNIAFANSSPMPDGKRDGAQAVAMRISGDKAAFHNCKFIGYQDTLCDDKGKHFFGDCHIQGTVDFIFGNGQSLYLNSTLESVAKEMGAITAQARNDASEESGFAFVHCKVSGTGNTYLGRAWKERPRVVFAYTYMGTLINPEGWSNSMFNDHNRTVYYGEFECMGPGAEEAKRADYARRMTDQEAKPFMSMTYIEGNKWLLSPRALNQYRMLGTSDI